MTDRLYYGDNLDILRAHVASESVDLVYLDPPFNSNATYNVLFRAPDGVQSQAQIEAFDDTWHWSDKAEDAYWQVLRGRNSDAALMLESMRKFLGENDMMAYLAMMAVRLIELHRVLKPTGSLYLHCDPVASHYLKILLDAVFEPANFRSEVVWRRTGSHNKAKRWAPIHDTIFFYSKSSRFTWNRPKRPYMLGHVNQNFVEFEPGRFRTDYYGNVLTGSGPRNGESGKPWRGFDPSAKNRHWAIPSAIWNEADVDPTGLTQHQKLDLLYKLGFIKIEKDAAWPIYEREILPGEGPAAPDIWAFQPYTEGTVFGTRYGIDADVRWLSPQDQERLCYPTQKPVALLERIIAASSNPADLVLDPFCGCGTTVHAAQKLGRRWIGIDVTHLAISLIERRLRDAFGTGADFVTLGVPKDLAAARDLAARDKHEFQKWAITLVPDAQPFRGGKKGADTGIDGIVYLKTGKNRTDKAIVEVKGGGVSVDQVHKLKSVIEREKALIGLFVTLEPPTKPMIAEAASAGFAETDIGRYQRIQILTVEGILNFREVPRLPIIDSGGFKKAPREKSDTQEGFGF